MNHNPSIQTSHIHAGMLPSVSVDASRVIKGMKAAKVLLNIAHVGDSRTNADAVKGAIRSAFGGKLEAVEGSFQSVEKNKFNERIMGLVIPVRESVVVSPGSLTAFRSVSSNMYMDGDENIWELKKSESGSLLVRSSGVDDDESLATLLGSCQNSFSSVSSDTNVQRVVNQAMSISDSVSGGDFVAYADVTNQIRYGCVVATDAGHTQALILPLHSREESVSCSTDCITALVRGTEIPNFSQSDDDVVNTAVASARGGITAATLIEYYRRIYGRNEAYWSELSARINNHAFC